MMVISHPDKRNRSPGVSSLCVKIAFFGANMLDFVAAEISSRYPEPECKVCPSDIELKAVVYKSRWP